MESSTVLTAKAGSTVRAVESPLRWIGADRILLDDETVYGLRRLVFARKAEPPEVSDLLEIVAGITQANVYAWCIEKDDGYWYLWIVWKETNE